MITAKVSGAGAQTAGAQMSCFGGQVLTWIQSWASGRRQKVDLGDRHSSWTTVLSGVSQRSVLDDEISLKISNFADDTKLCRAVGGEEEEQILRADLRRMFWQMLFNLKSTQLCTWERETTCSSLLKGGGRHWEQMKTKGTWERLCTRGKLSRQYDAASRKANSTLGMIRRTKATRDKDTVLRFCKSLVRPQLEYCI